MPFNIRKFNAIHQINPVEIVDIVDRKRIEEKTLAAILHPNAEPIVLDGDWDEPHSRKFQELDCFLAMRDCLLGCKTWQETAWYETVTRKISNGAVMWRCRSEQEFLQRLECEVRALFNDIKKNGFKTQKQLGTRKLSNEIRIAIDRSGHPMFIDGRHRLSIAILLGLESIPCKIVLRHQMCPEFRQNVGFAPA